MTPRMPNTSVRPTAMSAYTTPMVTPLTTCCRRTVVTRQAGTTSREAEIVHRAPVGDGDGVELQMELLAEVEGDLFGALRLHYAGVLPEDHILELLEHAVGLAEVVVLADQAVAAAALGRDRLRDEEINQLLAPAPVHVHHDRVGQAELVARAANGILAVLVREDRILRRALRFRTLELVVEDVSLGPHVGRDDLHAVRVAEQPGMHPWEVREVGEVLDLA